MTALTDKGGTPNADKIAKAVEDLPITDGEEVANGSTFEIRASWSIPRSRKNTVKVNALRLHQELYDRAISLDPTTIFLSKRGQKIKREAFPTTQGS